MGRELKFEYIFETQRYGQPIKKVIYKIEELENMEMELYLLEQGYKIIARRQYTGLKDKNGVEIYEGDILFDTLNKKYGEVKFNKYGCFTIFWKNWERMNYNIGERFNSWVEPENFLEIIGNIYENSNLLDNK